MFFLLRDCTAGRQYCYMWHEKRKRNSVVFVQIFLMELNVHYFSEMYVEDKISNNIVAVMFRVVQKYHPILRSINLKLFLNEHTHTECDTHHAATKHKKINSNTLMHHPAPDPSPFEVEIAIAKFRIINHQVVIKFRQNSFKQEVTKML
jgi:hypothetical protein